MESPQRPPRPWHKDKPRLAKIFPAAILILLSFYYLMTQPSLTTSSVPVPSPAAPPHPMLVATPHPLGVPFRRHEMLWAAFASRFGLELKGELSANGKIAVIHGAPGSGAKAVGSFRPDDEVRAIARAREVIDALREMLGLEPGLPLGQPSARTGPVSAQVSFPETLDGLPLEPVGSVIVDLGPEGELLNLTSNYVGPVQVVNSRSLSAEQAKAKAEAAVPQPGSALPTLGGNAIVWVTHTGPGGAPIGHQAFEFNVDGRQVVVDAGNGDVLFKRDRRQFFSPD